MATSSRLILAEQSAALILTALQQPSTRDRIKEHFGPICNCDVVQWVKDQIFQQNQAVIAKIRTLIAPSAVLPPAASSQTSYQGYATKFEDKGGAIGEVYTYFTSTGNSAAVTTVNVYTPAGTYIRQFCQGTTLMEERANGTGSSTNVVLQLNAPTCA